MVFWAVFTRSAITLPKVNRFRWNLEHSEYIVWGWRWQILGAIHTVATAGEPGEILLLFFLSGKQHNRFPMGQISRNLNATRPSMSRKLSEQNFENFTIRDSFSLKKNKNFSKKFNVLRLQFAITPQWLQIAAHSPPKPYCMGFLVSIFQSTLKSLPNKAGLKRPSVHSSTKSFFDFNEIWHVCRGQWVMNNGMWPDASSRSRALQSWKSFYFQKLSPLPFTMGADNWPLIRKLGHSI